MSGGVVLVLLAVVLVFLAGLLAAMDAALIRVSRIVAEALVKDSRRGARSLALVVADPAPYLGPLMLVRVVAEVGATACVAVLCSHAAGGGFAAIGLTTLIMGVVGFTVIAVGPATLGRQQSVPFALATAGVGVFVARLLGPLSRVLVLVGNAITPGQGFRDGPFSTEAELRDLVDQAEESGVVDQAASDMITAVFELPETLAREVMVPRLDVVWIDRTKTISQGLTLAMKSGFSRIPVVGVDVDDVIGVMFLKDLVRLTVLPDAKRPTVADVMRPAVYVPDTKPADALLREMQGGQIHMAIVIDEYGGTAGLVTIEDILEEIVGEITDEYDDEIKPVEDLGDGSYRLQARVLVEEVEDLFDVELENLEEVETVGGLLAAALGRVPLPGATVEVAGLTLVAESSAGRRNRIGTVLVSRTPVEAEEAAE